MATTFDTESEAQAVAVELNAAAERDVRYRAERYREKWAIARQTKRAYWCWDEFLPLDPSKVVQTNSVETVRRIVELALGDATHIVALMTILETGNEGGVSERLSNAGAGQAGIVVRNSLFVLLIILITREFARSREGDLHLSRAFDLLRGDTLAIFQGVGSSEDLSAAIGQWQRLRGDQRLNSLNHFRDKQTAHLGTLNSNIPHAINRDIFALGNAVVDLVDKLAKGTGMANVKVRDNIDAKLTADAFWRPWKKD